MDVIRSVLSRDKSYKDDDIRRVTNLVFQGGSVKGIAYVGAISALRKCFQERGLDFNTSIQNVAGTSAGAITALVLALDYSTDELLHYLAATDFKQWMEDDTSRVSREAIIDFAKQHMPRQGATVAGALVDINTKFGLFPGLKVLDWLEGLVKAKTGIDHCTFAEFHEIILKNRGGGDPTKSNFKELTVVGFNLTRDETKVFNYTLTPNTIISDSVRISMSIPVVFLPHKNYVKKFEDDGKYIRCVENDDLWVDGGLTYNYPIRVFDTLEFNRSTLGFYLVSPDDQYLFQTHSVREKNREITNGLEYVKALFESLVSSQQALAHLRSDDPKRTVYIHHGDVNALNFALTAAEKQELVDCGWAAVCDRFKLIGVKCDIVIPDESEKSETKSESCTVV